MKSMSSKQIKDNYGAFVEAARREPVVHTSHGRPTLVTISIDRARTLPGLREELQPSEAMKREDAIARFLAYGGSGVELVGEQSVEELRARSRFFRGTED